MIRETEFKRIVDVHPAYDERYKQFGIGSCSINFTIKGTKGAATFSLFTNWFLPHVREELVLNGTFSKKYSKPIGSEVCYHSYTRMCENDLLSEHCKVLNTTCYSGADFILCDQYVDILIEKGTEGMYEKLEEFYNYHFYE